MNGTEISEMKLVMAQMAERLNNQEAVDLLTSINILNSGFVKPIYL